MSTSAHLSFEVLGDVTPVTVSLPKSEFGNVVDVLEQCLRFRLLFRQRAVADCHVGLDLFRGQRHENDSHAGWLAMVDDEQQTAANQPRTASQNEAKQDDEPTERARFMRKKLRSSNRILEGLVIDHFELVTRGADDLSISLSALTRKEGGE